MANIPIPGLGVGDTQRKEPAEDLGGERKVSCSYRKSLSRKSLILPGDKRRRLRDQLSYPGRCEVL